MIETLKKKNIQFLKKIIKKIFKRHHHFFISVFYLDILYTYSSIQNEKYLRE